MNANIFKLKKTDLIDQIAEAENRAMMTRRACIDICGTRRKGMFMYSLLSWLDNADGPLPYHSGRHWIAATHERWVKRKPCGPKNPITVHQLRRMRTELKKDGWLLTDRHYFGDGPKAIMHAAPTDAFRAELDRWFALGGSKKYRENRALLDRQARALCAITARSDARSDARSLRDQREVTARSPLTQCTISALLSHESLSHQSKVESNESQVNNWLPANADKPKTLPASLGFGKTEEDLIRSTPELDTAYIAQAEDDYEDTPPCELVEQQQMQMWKFKNEAAIISLWQQECLAVHGLQPVELSNFERAVLLHFATGAEGFFPGHGLRLLSAVIHNWDGFCKHAKKQLAAFDWPLHPTIKFLWKYANAAFNGFVNFDADPGNLAA
jgi:hypothetical protein